MPDRGDYVTRKEFKVPIRVVLDHGLDANKKANPVIGETYLATDTEKVYICFVDGSWVEVWSA